MDGWVTDFSDTEEVILDASASDEKCKPLFSPGKTPWIYESTFKRKKRKNEKRRLRSLQKQRQKKQKKHTHPKKLKIQSCIVVDSKCISCFVSEHAFEYKKEMQWYILPNKKECPRLLETYLEKANKGFMEAIAVHAKLICCIPPFPFFKNGYCLNWDSVSISDYATLNYMIYMNQRARFSMKRLAAAWILKRRCTLVNDTDPYTLEEPIQPIKIVDWELRRIYRFEAKSILRDMIEKLLMSDNLFFTPKRPRNPLTNLGLTYGQLYSVWKQLTAVGRTHWILEAFAKCDFEFVEFRLTYEEPLRKASIEKAFSIHMNPSIGAVLLQFIIEEHDVHGFLCDETIYSWIIEKEPGCAPIQKWKSLCRNYYIFYTGNYSSEVYEREFFEISRKTKELCEFPLELYSIRNSFEGEQMCDL